MPGPRRDGQTVSGRRPCGHVAVAYSTGCQERLAGGADRTEFQVVPAGLADGRPDLGIGRATLAPTTVAAELFRLDGLGVLVGGAVRRAAAGTEFCAVLVRADRGRDGVAGRWWLLRHGIRGSLLCRAGDSSEHVRALVEGASSPAGSADWNPAPARD